MPDGPRYDDDFYAWTQHQAEVLRSMAVADNRFDREHVAEEIEDLGKSERDAVRSQIRRIIEHLLKLGYSPAEQPRLGWLETSARCAGNALGQDDPTLGRDAQEGLEQALCRGAAAGGAMRCAATGSPTRPTLCLKRLSLYI